MALRRKKQNQGFSLVELLVAIGIFAILAAGVTYVVLSSYRNFFGGGDRQVVVQFAQEGMEAVKSMRDNSWQAFVAAAGAGNKGVVKNASGLWEYSGTSNTLGTLTRIIVVSDVQRDTSYNIVASGGTNDPDTKKVLVTVSGFGISDYTLTSYFSNWSSQSWLQTDWSGNGAREFWSDAAMASSSFSNVNTSTSGELTLSQISGTEMSWSAWADLTQDVTAKYQAWEDFYNYYLGPDGKSLYIIGTVNFDFVKYDISRAAAGIIRPEFKIPLSWWHMMAMAINPNSDYAYLGRRLATTTEDVICITDLNDLSLDTVNDCYDLNPPGATWYITSMVINAAADRLYVFDNYGYGYTFSISNGGATLALLNAGQVLTPASGYTINQVYLDESAANPYIYLVTDHNSGEFIKMGFDSDKQWFSSTSTYAYVDSSPTADYTDIELLEVSSGKNRFILGTESSTEEFMIVEDQGSSLTKIGSYNVPTSQSYAEVTSDRANMAFLHYYSPASVYAIDITNRASPTDASMSNTTFNTHSNYYTYDQMLYSTTSYGFFVHDHVATSNLVNLHFIGRSFTKATGGTFDYKRAITLGLGSTVSSGPHTDFPVVISETQEYLKSVANGGKVYNENGYDIIFASDSDGNTVLDHEIETYNPTNGELVAWVKIPSLATNTTIYMFYGNPNITSTQENVDGVWSNNYQIVSHMNDVGVGGVSTSLTSSNGWFKYGVNAPTGSSGKIGRGQSFDGSYDYLTVEKNADKDQTTNDFTVEFWVKPSATYVSTSNGLIYFGNGDFSNDDGWMFAYYPTLRKLRFGMGNDNHAQLGNFYSSAITADDSTWTYTALTADRDVGYQFYLNTAADTSLATTSVGLSIGETYDGVIGRWYSLTDYFFKGELDEFRVSLTLRSAGWMTTGYNNINSTSTFYSIGEEAAASGYQSPGYIYSSIYDLGSADKELRSVTVEQNVPSGCGLSITMEASDSSAFSSVVSNVFSDVSASIYTSSTPVTLNHKRYLRYKVDMTNCNSNSQAPTLYSVKWNFK
ncbi:MAG: DUF2341 domain-containing protein [Patescibacteria group bacterium]